MSTVTSKDGTTIAYDAQGTGPALIMVDGALGYRGFDPISGLLGELLAQDFTVYQYDRRGRGESGDTAPYAVEREVEDIAALIAAAGGEACVYGLSSGGVLALDAAASLPAISKLAIYEPPFIIDNSRKPLPNDYVAHLDGLIAQGRRGDAVEYFMTAALGVPEEYLTPMRQDPSWETMEGVAHTLAYDGRVVEETMRGKPLPTDRWTTVTIPTLVVDGSESEAFMHLGAQAIADLLSKSERQTLEGQMHNVDPNALAPVLAEFFRD